MEDKLVDEKSFHSPEGNCNDRKNAAAAAAVFLFFGTMKERVGILFKWLTPAWPSRIGGCYSEVSNCM